MTKPERFDNNDWHVARLSRKVFDLSERERQLNAELSHLESDCASLTTPGVSKSKTDDLLEMKWSDSTLKYIDIMRLRAAIKDCDDLRTEIARCQALLYRCLFDAAFIPPEPE